jgi:hypothetical protein
VRRVCALLLALAGLVALVLVNGQHKFALSVFEFQQYRQYEGLLCAQPYPTLLVAQPGGTAPAAILLVAPGKHGAEVARFDRQRVRLQGARVYRDGLTMLEILPGSLTRLDATEPASIPTPEALGEFTLAGEIVDSKCYLGVMNPGHTKPHRECAARCISGGIPPLFRARDRTGRSVALLLVSNSGAPVNQAVLDYVAEPVEITGQAVRVGEQLYLYADPASYRRFSAK